MINRIKEDLELLACDLWGARVSMKNTIHLNTELWIQIQGSLLIRWFENRLSVTESNFFEESNLKQRVGLEYRRYPCICILYAHIAIRGLCRYGVGELDSKGI